MMNNTISFMSANFVARELGYRMAEGWMQGDAATQAYFRPENTFAQRFDALLAEIVDCGYSAIDIWVAHLHPEWATPAQIADARRLLNARGLTVSSLAASLSDNELLFAKTAEIAHALGTNIIGGGCQSSLLGERRDWFVKQLEKHDLVFGFENHPQPTAARVLETIGGSADGRIGVAVDTGWFGSQSFPADQAIRELGDRIVHVHLKDIHAPVKTDGPTLKAIGHETCALGDGVVPIEGCLAALREIGYTGGISFEHEPEDHDPSDDARTSLSRLKHWMSI